MKTNPQNPQNDNRSHEQEQEKLHQELQKGLNYLQSKQELKEMPDISQLIMNSLKISKKIQGQIISKEFSVKHELQQVNTKLQTFSREMQEIYSKTQRLYEETVRQNNKSRFMVEQFIKPFREQLKGKVDETALSIKMKMILSQFDHLGHKISYDGDEKANEADHNHTFRFVKMELLPFICKIQHQVQQKNLLASKQAEELLVLREKQSKLQVQLKESKQEISQVKTSCLDEIENKMNEELWNSKFKRSQNRLMSSINPIVAALDNDHKKLSRELDVIKTELSSIKSYDFDAIKQNQKKIESVKIQFQKVISANFDESIKQLTQKIESNQLSLQQDLRNLEETLTNYCVKQLLKSKENVECQFEAITSELQTQVQRIVMNFDKGHAYKVSKLDSDFKFLQEHLKKIIKDVEKQHFQISYIKDLLSKKANFSDVIIHMEGKANKQDYKQLKNLIEKKGDFFTQNSQEQLKYITQQEEVKEEPSSNKFRKRLSTSGRKNYQQTTSPSPHLADAERDDSVKRYMLGLKNGTSNYTRENLLKEKAKFMMMNQTDRLKVKPGKRGDSMTENII